MFRKCRVWFALFVMIVLLVSCNQTPWWVIVGPDNFDNSSITTEEASKVASDVFNSLNQNAIKDDVKNAIKHFMGDDTVSNNPNISRVANTTFISVSGTEYPIENKGDLEGIASILKGVFLGFVNLENPFHMPLDESAPSMRTSIEFSEYSSCFWENGNTKSILAGQVDVIGNIIDVIFNTQAYDSIAGNSKEVLVSIFGTYDIATAEDSPLQILMKDESASRYDLAFSGLGGAFKLTANIDASQISLLRLPGADLSEIISMLKNSVKGYEIIVYVPETTDEFSATVTDPSTGDSKRLSWNSISLGEKTNSINEDALFAIVDEFSKTVSNVSYDAATFFKDLNSALVDGKTDDGQLEITNFGTLAVVDDELKFELMLNGYSCGTENPATGTVVITFQDKESGGDFTSIDADITCSIEGFDFSGRGYVLGNIFSSQEPIQFTMSADKVASITANDNGIYTIGIQTLNDIDMELLF